MKLQVWHYLVLIVLLSIGLTVLNLLGILNGIILSISIFFLGCFFISMVSYGVIISEITKKEE